MKIIEIIEKDNKKYAIILRKEYEKEGITFITEKECIFQMGVMKHPKKHIIQPHIHRDIIRTISKTTEVLFIKKGKLKTKIFDENKNKISEIILNEGDIIMLLGGGHGFECLEKTSIVEIKQGPFIDSDKDKIKFDNVLCDKK